jgi:hypothetical protein
LLLSRGEAGVSIGAAQSAEKRPKQRRHQRRRWLPLANGKQAPRPGAYRIESL